MTNILVEYYLPNDSVRLLVDQVHIRISGGYADLTGVLGRTRQTW